MHSSTLAWSVLLLSAGLVLAAPAQEKPKKRDKAPKQQDDSAPAITVEEGDLLAPGAWNREFDYTRLPLSNAAYWQPLSGAAVEMEQAITAAAEALGGTVWVQRAELGTHADAPAWHLEAFAGGGESEAPRRVDVVVSAAKPEVLQRTEIPSLSAADAAIWNRLGRAEVQAQGAIEICKVRSRGEKPEPEVTEPRMRKLEFVPMAGGEWACELMGIMKELPRRFHYAVKSDKPRIKEKRLLDRFAGEPLRKGEPIEREDGMYLYDFIVGDGPAITADSKVRVHYRLFLLDNSKLHDTYKSNLPETFVVSQAPLRGMTEGMIGMRVGGKRKIAMPYTLAFGEQGNEIAPPHAMVVCDVRIEELISE